jgi:hypothetical protein
MGNESPGGDQGEGAQTRDSCSKQPYPHGESNPGCHLERVES